MKKSIKKASKPALSSKSKGGKAKALSKGTSKLAKTLKSKSKASTKPIIKVAVKPKSTGKASKIAAKGPKSAGDAKTKLSKEEKKAQVIAQIVAIQKEESEVVLTNADGKQYCKVHDCDQGQTTEGYCRLHYIAFWKRNRSKMKILEGGKLDKYIEDLTNKYPDKYLEMLRKDLSNEKDFNLIVAEMDVEDSGDDHESEEDASRFIEEVRGGVPTADDDEGGF